VAAGWTGAAALDPPVDGGAVVVVTVVTVVTVFAGGAVPAFTSGRGAMEALELATEGDPTVEDVDVVVDVGAVGPTIVARERGTEVVVEVAGDRSSSW
jgi:hypothetical protein